MNDKLTNVNLKRKKIFKDNKIKKKRKYLTLNKNDKENENDFIYFLVNTCCNDCLINSNRCIAKNRKSNSCNDYCDRKISRITLNLCEYHYRIKRNHIINNKIKNCIFSKECKNQIFRRFLCSKHYYNFYLKKDIYTLELINSLLEKY